MVLKETLGVNGYLCRSIASMIWGRVTPGLYGIVKEAYSELHRNGLWVG